LIAALTNGNSQVRYLAAYSLGIIKDLRAVNPLIATLKDKDPGTRMCAVEALGKIKDPRAINPLIAALNDKGWEIRGSGFEASNNIGTIPVAYLNAAVKDRGWYLREKAAEALGEIGTLAVEPLIAALMDTDTIVRKGAAEALSNMNDPRAVSALLAAWKKGNSAVITGADFFFIQRGEPGSEDALIEALNQFGDREMAYDLLNCGNSKLEEAARAWAKSHGYQNMKIPGRGSAQWGSAR
jgi:HEAT repeat protein